MPNYTLNPTYYRVTWDNTAFPGLTGSRAGGLDSVTAWDYVSKISTTGTVDASGGVLADGDSLLINGVEIAFTAADLVNDIIVKINLASQLTRVTANNSIDPDRITLCNASGHEGETFQLAEGVDALTKLGFTAGVYGPGLYVTGGEFTGGLAVGNTFKINGITMQVPAGFEDDPANVAALINQHTIYTSVVARPAAATVQLIATASQPITTAAGTGNPTAFGFPPGTYAGSPSTIEQSMEKSQANARWQQVVNRLGEFATPTMLDDALAIGNVDGSAAPDQFIFTVGYDRPDMVSTPDELNLGSSLTGSAAIRRAVARGLAGTYRGNAKIFDPRSEIRNELAYRPNAARIINMTTDGISEDLAALESAITVAMIAYA
jgi:hypothetical protein